jgi:hypothetical protein
VVWAAGATATAAANKAANQPARGWPPEHQVRHVDRIRQRGRWTVLPVGPSKISMRAAPGAVVEPQNDERISRLHDEPFFGRPDEPGHVEIAGRTGQGRIPFRIARVDVSRTRRRCCTASRPGGYCCPSRGPQSVPRQIEWRHPRRKRAGR